MGDFKFFDLKRADTPSGGDDNRHRVNEHHLVKLKNFGCKWPEEKGSNEE